MSEHPSTANTIRSIEDLPTLSAVAQKLLVQLNDTNYTADDVSRTIESDQALAMRILRLVNSPAYGIVRDISTIERAVVILGAEALKNLVMCAGVAGAMTAIGSPARLTAFWRHAAYVGTAARVLAEMTSLADPQDAFLAGLVHDIGELALDVVRPEEWNRITALGARDRLTNEKRYLGMTHQRAGYLLLRSWNMPEELCTVARSHHSTRELSSRDCPLMGMVSLADTMSRVAGAGADLPANDRDLVRMLRATGLDLEQLVEAQNLADHRMAAMVAFLGLPQTALPPGAVGRGRGLRAVLLCSGKRRLAWYQQLCRYHDLELLSLRMFLERPEDADLVLLDQESLGRDQLEKLAPFLRRCDGSLASCGCTNSDLATRVLDQPIPNLELVFTPQELSATLALVAAR